MKSTSVAKPSAAPAKKGGRKKKDEAKEEEVVVEESPTIIPADQLKLTPKQLDEDITRVITAGSPRVPHGLVSFSFPEREYKAVPAAADEGTIFHTTLRSCSLLSTGEDAAAQKDYEKRFRTLVEDRRRARLMEAQEQGKELSQAELEEDDTQRNQFNFTERAVQTYNATTKTRVVSTTPPDSTTASGEMTQWALYDSYLQEYESAVALSAASQKKDDEIKSAISHNPDPMHNPEMASRLRVIERIVNQNAEDEIYTDFKYWEDMSDVLKEDGSGTCLPLWRFEDARTKRKMVTSLAWNVGFPDLFAVGYGSYDFMRQGSGLICVYSLKNVGSFEYTFTCESGVMSMDFHPVHAPLLCVGLYDGSVRVYDVRRRENKPIFASDARSGKHSDPVWEVRWARDAPGAPPSAATSNEPVFYSVSSDGIIATWAVTKSELRMEPIIALKVVSAPGGDVPGGAIVESAQKAAAAEAAALAATASSEAALESVAIATAGANGAAGSGIAAVAALRPATAAEAGGAGAVPEASAGVGASAAAQEENVAGLAGGCCVAFSPFFPTAYIVGTEEGRIHKGSLETSGQLTATFGGGHHMTVYALRWSPWHPRVFLSASADWTVKLWDDSHTTGPIMNFDLGTSVGDIAWAPYSSTVFAAITDDGKVSVWDLAVNKRVPLCNQPIVKKSVKCTHVCFNAAAPILLVGDSSGSVSSLKLSPNLRKVTPIPIPVQKKGDAPIPPPRREEVEIRKLDGLLLASDARISVVTDVPGMKIAAVSEVVAAD